MAPAPPAQLGPEILERYLEARGWRRRRDDGPFAVWVLRRRGQETVEVDVPRMPRARDYARRLDETIETLSMVEGRAATAIRFDVAHVEHDVVRVRAAGEAALGNSIPLDAGPTLLQSASNMMAAAAAASLSSDSPRVVFDGRRPNAVVDYMRSLRLGQTESGSYVMTVLSPVRRPPENANQLELQFRDGRNVVISAAHRGVTRTLGRALVATQHAAERSRSGRLDAFEASVQDGVSANLLEAVGDAARVERLGELEVSVAWAPVLDEPSSAPAKAVFRRDALEVIAYAGRELRGRYAPRLDFVLQGYVRKVDRPADAFIGRVVIEGSVEGRVRKVSMDLSGADLAVAIDSVRDERASVLVECRGRLDKQSAGYVLRDAHDLRRVPEAEVEAVDEEPGLIVAEGAADDPVPARGHNE